jgi:hypothetical protein
MRRAKKKLLWERLLVNSSWELGRGHELALIDHGSGKGLLTDGGMRGLLQRGLLDVPALRVLHLHLIHIYWRLGLLHEIIIILI